MERLKIERSKDGTRVYVQWQPGNGTRYVGFGMKIPSQVDHYGDKWLVSFPEFGGAWYFEEGTTVYYDYVQEKYSKRYSGSAMGTVDASEMAKVIAYIVPGTVAGVITDEQGARFDADDRPREFTPND